MPERPLLLFPTPDVASRSTLGGGGGRVRRPTLQRQWDRLSPIFRQLQTAFDARRVEIQQSAAGITPEQVLVIETIGSIDNFANAVKRIDGLEWMGEIEIDEIAPDEEFYDKIRQYRPNRHPERTRSRAYIETQRKRDWRKKRAKSTRNSRHKR